MPLVLGSFDWRAVLPSSRALHNTHLAEIVALCDTDMGAKHTLPVLKDFPDVPRFQDFRKMIDAGGLDAVTVGTPDHTHAAITAAALRAGLHVYCEKPLARSISA